jgi:4-carboxymuconolactone decarboxylase
MENRALFDRGRRMRRAVLGAEHDNALWSLEDSFSLPIRELTTKYVWGEIWSRKGLPRKTRSLINIALLTAMRSPHELKLHIRGARNNGCSQVEIREVLMQCAVYCGVPAVREAVRNAREVFEQEKKKSRRK